MRWHIAQPLDARGFEAHIGVKAARDCVVDDRLPIFLQQFDEPLPATNIAVDALVGLIEIADDGGLFGEGWESYRNFSSATLGVSRNLQWISQSPATLQSEVVP